MTNKIQILKINNQILQATVKRLIFSSRPSAGGENIGTLAADSIISNGPDS